MGVWIKNRSVQCTSKYMCISMYHRTCMVCICECCETWTTCKLQRFRPTSVSIAIRFRGSSCVCCTKSKYHIEASIIDDLITKALKVRGSFSSHVFSLSLTHSTLSTLSLISWVSCVHCGWLGVGFYTMMMTMMLMMVRTDTAMIHIELLTYICIYIFVACEHIKRMLSNKTNAPPFHIYTHFMHDAHYIIRNDVCALRKAICTKYTIQQATPTRHRSDWYT